ncbi:MAG: hypothetical protein CFE21_14950 [Bacteroidetes bacterium B1(2017)]|nr:MAG: hypothetical protein CFE21_14950 [Bacteroidetes bacterium B1(2017)]
MSFFAFQLKSYAQVINYGADSIRKTGENISPVERAKVLRLINTRNDDLQIIDHPLLHSWSIINKNQIKPDSLFNSLDSAMYIVYLNDTHLPIMWIKIGMKHRDKYQFTRVYNETNSQIIFEEILGSNYIYRNRIEYDEAGIPFLNCIYESSGGKHGIKYLKENNKGDYINEVIEDNCHCDW